MSEGLDSAMVRRVEEELKRLIQTGALDEKKTQLVTLRYGLDQGKPHTVQEIARLLKRPIKKVRQDLESAERRVFNLLKDHL